MERTNQRSNSYTIIIIIVLACIVMAFVEAVLAPGYALKSVMKLILFLILPVIVLRKQKDIDIVGLIKLKRNKLLLPILLGIGVYLFIIVAYYTIGSLFDFSQVAKAITASSGVGKMEFVWVSLYISLVNSFVEEAFFRGIGFLVLGSFTSRRFAFLFSAAAFSLYHVAIMSSWFSFSLFLLLLISLFIAGLLFNWLNEKYKTILPSWMVHVCANFAINTIGFILFGIL